MVDIDLEAFFDRVNHDRLMVRVRAHVDAPDVLKLINRFLKVVGDNCLGALPAKLFRQMGARVGTGQGSMRTTVMQGTAGYVTRMSGGVGGRGREASSYPD